MKHKIFKLCNGLSVKYCVMPDSFSVAILLALKGGTGWESSSQKGITHLVEHLCFRRCAGMDQEKFYHKIEKTGGTLSAKTYRDSVIFEIEVHPQFFCEAIEVIKSLFENNEWTHEDIRREKEVVMREIEGRGAFCYHALMYQFWNKKPPCDFISGTKNKVRSFSLPQLTAWKNTLFCTQNTTVVISGNINPSDIDAASKLLTEIPASSLKASANDAPKNFLNRTSDDDECFTDKGGLFANSDFV